MASPVNVTTTPTLLIGKNKKRKNVIIQNIGNEIVYIKKWPYNVTVAPIPSPTNYDFILEAKPGEGNKTNCIFQTETISAFVGVTATKTSNIAAFETVKVVL
jgi:hypothetical protein